MKKLTVHIALFLSFSLCFSEKITLRADMLQGNSKNKTNPTKLIGNAFVKTETMEISADTIILSGNDFRFITAEGSVIGKNTESKMDFTCGIMKYDRETKIARLEDTVSLKDIENEVDAQAQIIEYNQNTEISILQIGVNLKQKDNTCTAAYAVYKKKTQMLELSGNPKIIQGDDTFRAQEITLNLDTQEITLDGRVSGTVTDSKEEKPKEEVPPEPKPTSEPKPISETQKEEPETTESKEPQQAPEENKDE